MGAPEMNNEFAGALKPGESTSDTSGSISDTISQSQTSNSDQETSAHPKETQPPGSNASNLTAPADSQSNATEKNVDPSNVVKLSVKFEEMAVSGAAVNKVAQEQFQPKKDIVIDRLSIEINPHTGKRMDLWSSIDFTAPRDDKLRPATHYLREGKRLKFTADNMEEPCEIAIGSLYLRAAMCFLMAGYALDKQNCMHLALKIYIQTLIQFKEVIGLYDHLSKQGPYRIINKVLHILGLQTLGVLNFKLNNANKDAVGELSQFQKKHEYELMKKLEHLNLAWSNIPFDIELQNSELYAAGSVGGYDSESTVSGLTDIPEHLEEMTQTTDYLTDANRVWDDSLDLIYAAEMENFFDEVYSKSTDLSKIIDVNCSVLEFVNYVNNAIFLLHEPDWFEVLYEHAEDPFSILQ